MIIQSSCHTSSCLFSYIFLSFLFSCVSCISWFMSAVRPGCPTRFPLAAAGAINTGFRIDPISLHCTNPCLPNSSSKCTTSASATANASCSRISASRSTTARKSASSARTGPGKSTLLRIMAGIDTDIDGTAALAKNMRVRYVAQEPLLDLDKTVRENLRTSMKPIQDLVDRFNADHPGDGRAQGGRRPRQAHGGNGPLAGEDRRLRRLGTRPPDGHRLRRPRAAARRHAGAAALRRRAPPRGACAWPCWKSPTCCSWTSPPTTSTPRPCSGWNRPCATIPAR